MILDHFECNSSECNFIEYNFYFFCIKMEFQKITNFLDITFDNKDLPKFVTKKWIEVYDQSQGNYDVNKETRIKTSMLRPNICDYSDAYIIAKGNITVTKKTYTANDFEASNNTVANANVTNNENNKKKLFFKNNPPFISCISKINYMKIDNAEDLDIVRPRYNLLEYSKNYRKTTDSFWNYYRDELNSGVNNNITHSILNSESFDYKANFMENGVTHTNLTKNNVKIVISLKHLSNFWKSLNIPLINCEVETILNQFRNCVLIDKLKREANYDADPDVQEIDNPENAVLQITDTKLYVPVVSLSKENDKAL